MNHRYFLYIAKLYTRNMLMLLLVITFVIVLLDYLHHSPQGITKTILYLFYTWQFRLSQFYPLAIVFAAMVTYLNLIYSNKLISLLSFGYTKKRLFIPFILPAILLYCVIVSLQNSEFAYARERAKSILNETQSLNKSSNLFFKYNNSFVYVHKLDPIKHRLEDIIVFEFKNDKLYQSIVANSAIFNNGQWIAKNAIKITKIYADNQTIKGFKKKHLKEYKLLAGYRPKVIKLIYNGDSISLADALQTYMVLRKQGLDSYKIRASLYNKLILPIFALAVVAILFFKTSSYARYMNRSLVWTLTIGGTLTIWGVLYALFSLAVGGVVLPELATLLPITLLLWYAIHLYMNTDKKLA